MKTIKPEDQVEVSGEVSVREAGRRGGLSTSARYRSTSFYRKIGARGGETTKRRWGHLFSQFGKKGGRPRRPNLRDSMGEEAPQKKENAVGLRTSSPT